MGESSKSHIGILHLFFFLIDISVLADPLQRVSEFSLVSDTAERIQSKVEHFFYLAVQKRVEISLHSPCSPPQLPHLPVSAALTGPHGRILPLFSPVPRSGRKT